MNHKSEIIHSMIFVMFTTMLRAKCICSSALYERDQWHLLIFYLVMILTEEFIFLLASVNGLYSFTMLFTMDTVSTNLGIKVNVADVCAGFG